MPFIKYVKYSLRNTGTTNHLLPLRKYNLFIIYLLTYLLTLSTGVYFVISCHEPCFIVILVVFRQVVLDILCFMLLFVHLHCDILFRSNMISHVCLLHFIHIIYQGVALIGVLGYRDPFHGNTEGAAFHRSKFTTHDKKCPFLGYGCTLRSDTSETRQKADLNLKLNN